MGYKCRGQIHSDGEMNGIEMHYVKDTNNKKKDKKQSCWFPSFSHVSYLTFG